MSEHPGVILAGGDGTRLSGVTKFYNKQLSLVYDRPMIEYPVQTMKDMGVDFLHIVSSPQGIHDMFRAYRDEILGVPVRYSEQLRPLGTAHALGKTAVEGVFPVLCGDVYLDPAPEPADKPTLYWHEFDGAQNHSVWNPETNEIVEKPTRDIGRRAIIAYYYDDRVYDVIKNLQPSERGEFELIDLHNWYLQNGAEVKEYKGKFVDMGTPDGAFAAAEYINLRRTDVEWAKNHTVPVRKRVFDPPRGQSQPEVMA